MIARAFKARAWEDPAKIFPPATMRACRACAVDLDALALDFRSLLDSDIAIDGVMMRCRAVRHAGLPTQQVVLLVEPIADVQPGGE